MLVIGHNPMMEDLATAFPATASRRQGSLNSGFPTSGLAVIRFPGEPARTPRPAAAISRLSSPRPIIDETDDHRAGRAHRTCHLQPDHHCLYRSFAREALIGDRADQLHRRGAGSPSTPCRAAPPSLFSPSLRLGVTGLSRAGKTVFISALVHNLLHGGRLPLFEAQKSGRIARAFLEHQPDDAVPRFQYEDHIAALVDDRVWPDSTRAISELRLTIEYESASGWNRLFSSGQAVGRHRRLSRRMAARPAAARQELRRILARRLRAGRRCRSAPNSLAGLAAACRDPSIRTPMPTR